MNSKQSDEQTSSERPKFEAQRSRNTINPRERSRSKEGKPKGKTSRDSSASSTRSTPRDRSKLDMDAPADSQGRRSGHSLSFEEELVKFEADRVMARAEIFVQAQEQAGSETKVSTVALSTTPTTTVTTTSVTSMAGFQFYGSSVFSPPNSSNAAYSFTGTNESAYPPPGQVAQSGANSLLSESQQSGHGFCTPGLSQIEPLVQSVSKLAMGSQSDLDKLSMDVDTTVRSGDSAVCTTSQVSFVTVAVSTAGSRSVNMTDTTVVTSVLTGGPRASTQESGLIAVESGDLRSSAAASGDNVQVQVDPAQDGGDVLMDTLDERLQKRPLDSSQDAWADDVDDSGDPASTQWPRFGEKTPVVTEVVSVAAPAPKVQRLNTGDRRIARADKGKAKLTGTFVFPGTPQPPQDQPSGSGLQAPVRRQPQRADTKAGVRVTGDTSSAQSRLQSRQTPFRTEESGPKRTRPPLIVVNSGLGANVFRDIRAIKDKFTDKFVANHYSSSSTYQMANKEDHFRMTEYLLSRNLHFHTWSCPEDRNGRVVIRQLPIDTPISDIEAALREKGFQIQKVLRMAKRGNAPEPFPLFLVIMEGLDQLHDLLHMTNIDGVGVRVELYKGGGKATQCFRCQALGHTTHGCHEQVRCVKCASNHDSKTCVLPPGTQPKCCLCGGPHTANYSQCPHRLKWLQNRERRSTQQNRRSTKAPPAPPLQSDTPRPVASSQSRQRSYAQVTRGSDEVTRTSSSDSSDVMAALREILALFKSCDFGGILAALKESLLRFRAATGLVDKCEAILHLIMTVVEVLPSDGL